MNQPERIAVTFILPSFAGGGAERIVLSLARHLNRSRFRPELIVLDGTGPLRDTVAPDIPVVDLKAPRLRHGWKRLGEALQRVPGGVVIPTISHINLAVLAARRRLPAGTRIVARESNTPSASLATTGWPWLMRRLYARFFPFADAVLCPSARVAREFVEDFRLRAEKLVVLPHPVDTAAVRSAAGSPERIAGGGRRFVAAGRMTPQKGFDLLLDMFAELPEDSHLSLLGDGKDLAALRQQAEQLGIAERVDFPGFMANPWPYYVGADAFLLSSRWEGMPNAALESLALGTPVIAWRRTGGVNEIDARPDAVLLADDPAGFVAAMHSITARNDKSLRSSLLPERFELGSVMAKFEALLETVTVERA